MPVYHFLVLCLCPSVEVCFLFIIYVYFSPVSCRSVEGVQRCCLTKVRATWCAMHTSVFVEQVMCPVSVAVEVHPLGAVSPAGGTYLSHCNVCVISGVEWRGMSE